MSQATSDGGRGSEYRRGQWFLRVFGWDCGFVLTPAVRHRKVYVRWALFTRESHGWGIQAYRDEEEPCLDLSAGRLGNLNVALPEYRPSHGTGES